MRLLLAALLAACTSLPPEQLPVAHNPSGESAKDIPGPEPTFTAGGQLFVVRAYEQGRAASVMSLAEEDYRRVMTDTGLWSFKPAGLYPVVLYRGLDEYLSKAGAPPGRAASRWGTPSTPSTARAWRAPWRTR